MKNYKASDIDIVKIDGSGRNAIQIIFWPQFTIYGHLKKSALKKSFRDDEIEGQDFGTDYYNISEEEANDLTSMCQDFEVEVYSNQGRHTEIINVRIGPQNTFSDLVEVLKPIFEGREFEEYEQELMLNITETKVLMGLLKEKLEELEDDDEFSEFAQAVDPNFEENVRKLKAKLEEINQRLK